MSDDFDEITDLLKKSQMPKASEEAKKLAISKAMEEFEKKHSGSHQGIAFVDRLIDAVRTVYQQTIGEFTMRKAYIVAGGICVTVIAVGLMNSTYLSTDLLPVTQGSRAGIVASIQPSVMMAGRPETMTREVADEMLLKDKKEADARAREENVAQKKPVDTVIQEGKLNKVVSEAAPMLATPPAPSQPSLDSSLRQDLSSVAKSSEPMEMKNQPAKTVQMERAMSGKEKAGMFALGSAAKPSSDKAFVGGSTGLASSAYAPQQIFISPTDQLQHSYHDEGRDKFQDIKENPTKLVTEEPVSTFSVDVDTSSYSFMRASLNNNVLPQKDAIRIEEMVNYFPYDYEVPKDKSEPFKANVSVFPTPWNPDTKLMHIGIKGYQIEQKEKPHSNLVFLIDTSGSMNEQNKLPLLKNSLKLLLDNLQADDTVAIVTYAGSAGVALEPTKVSDKSKISNILDSLGAGGSTAGAEGIRTAYQLAESHFNKNGVNRVILATDGDFNVGITNQEELKSFIERKRDSGVFLSVLGFGRGNYNDALMQTLAQNGNGNAAYIDNLSEARKALVEESGSTLFTIAKDVKIQVEFNPHQVAEYRLIGYETRLLNREDFNNDKIDAGDIGSGHAVTAVYEITPAGSKARLIDDSRYQKPAIQPEDKNTKNSEYAFVKIRYKLPDSDTSKLITTPVDSKVEYKELSQVPADARFATSVAAFAQLLRGDSYTKSYKYDDVIDLAQSAKGEDKFGYRAEFINMVRLAKSAAAMQQPVQPQPVPQPEVPIIKLPYGAVT